MHKCQLRKLLERGGNNDLAPVSPEHADALAQKGSQGPPTANTFLDFYSSTCVQSNLRCIQTRYQAHTRSPTERSRLPPYRVELLGYSCVKSGSTSASIHAIYLAPTSRIVSNPILLGNNISVFHASLPLPNSKFFGASRQTLSTTYIPAHPRTPEEALSPPSRTWPG